MRGPCSRLSSRELLERARRLVKVENLVAAEFIACLSFIDSTKAAIDAGYPSLFAFCVSDLRLSEASASKRVRTARAARDCMELLSYLRTGELSIDGAAILSPFLHGPGATAVLEAAKGKSLRQLEELVASLSPRPEKADFIRCAVGAKPPAAAPSDAPELAFATGSEEDGAARGADDGGASPQSKPARAPEASSSVPGSTPGTAFVCSSAPVVPPAPAAPRPRDAVKPLASDRVHFSFSGSQALRLAVERLRALLRHKFPAGRLEDLLLEAAAFYLRKRDPGLKAPAQRRAQRERRRRRIPQWVKDEVWRRDGGRCAFISQEGRLCGAQEALEYDHVRPWALGGESDAPDNVRLLCRAHNRRAAELLGLRLAARSSPRVSPPG